MHNSGNGNTYLRKQICIHLRKWKYMSQEIDIYASLEAEIYISENINIRLKIWDLFQIKWSQIFKKEIYSVLYLAIQGSWHTYIFANKAMYLHATSGFKFLYSKLLIKMLKQRFISIETKSCSHLYGKWWLHKKAFYATTHEENYSLIKKCQ